MICKGSVWACARAHMPVTLGRVKDEPSPAEGKGEGGCEREGRRDREGKKVGEGREER